MLGAVEDVRRRRVDRDGAGARRRVGDLLGRVDGAGSGPERGGTCSGLRAIGILLFLVLASPGSRKEQNRPSGEGRLKLPVWLGVSCAARCRYAGTRFSLSATGVMHIAHMLIRHARRKKGAVHDREKVDPSRGRVKGLVREGRISGNPEPGSPNPPGLLLGAEDRVLGGLGDAELHDALGGDLDRLAGGRVAAHARLAVHEHELAEARQREGVLRLLVGERRELLEELRGDLLRRAGLLGRCAPRSVISSFQPCVPSFRSISCPKAFSILYTKSANFRRKSSKFSRNGAPARLPGVRIVFFGSPAFAVPSADGAYRPRGTRSRSSSRSRRSRSAGAAT